MLQAKTQSVAEDTLSSKPVRAWSIFGLSLDLDEFNSLVSRDMCFFASVHILKVEVDEKNVLLLFGLRTSKLDEMMISDSYLPTSLDVIMSSGVRAISRRIRGETRW